MNARTALLVLIAAFGLSVLLPVEPGRAQAPERTAEPGGVENGPTLEPAAQATADARDAAWLDEYESRSLHDYRVAYLIAPDASLGTPFMAADVIAESLGAVIFHTWDDFAADNEQSPFQFILFHDSIYDEVDLEWTQWAYRNQRMLVGIGTPFDHYVEITGERCQKDPNPHRATVAHTYVILFTYTWIYNDERQRVEIDPEAVECGSRHPSVHSRTASLMHGGGSFPLTSEEFLGSLVGRLRLRSLDYYP